MIEQQGDCIQLAQSSAVGDNIASNLLGELLLIYVKANPLRFFIVAFWALKGRAYLMARLAGVARCDARLPLRGLASRNASLREWIKALRLHHWLKNCLIFVPIFLGSPFSPWQAWVNCCLAFTGMGCIASATYMLNDLMDIQDDRLHPSKRHRAIAAGRIALRTAGLLIPLGFAAGFGFAGLAKGFECILLFGIYLAVSSGYSLGLKRIPLLDVALISGLFTLRLAIGVVCASVAWSAWLLVFSMLIFGSISLAKRSVEIRQVSAQGGTSLPGRGYVTADQHVVTFLGLSLASSAILVMMLYLIDGAFPVNYYRAPDLLWACPCILTAWLGRIWLLCGRGALHDDPVIFAIQDRASLALGFCFGLSFVAALLA